MPISCTIPARLTAGDTAQWLQAAFTGPQAQAIDAGAWALTYSLRGPVPGGNLDLAGTPQGSGWAFTLSSAQSAALNPGPAVLTWHWQACATQPEARVTVGAGVLRVEPSLAGLAPGAAFDGRSRAEQDLEAIRAEMTARIHGGATVEYTIGSRSLKKEPMSELIAMEQRCLRIVASERRAAAVAQGLGDPGHVFVRFM